MSAITSRAGLWTLVSVLACSASVQADTVVDFGATNQSIRLNADRANDVGMVDVAVRVCDAFVEQIGIPAFYCQSQVHFSVDGRQYMPQGWEQQVATSLREEVLSSRWLMQRLEVGQQALAAMSIDVFIRDYLKQPKRAAIIRSWLNSRAKQLQPKS
ncbi:hypothetical protein GCM10011352_22270 [Marinobacterium zhoushanense]|uniref:Uncharacterized protein n=1 Tax=Marinobacterium zhoushanense TaxID=1679163 RepID=A0ABQ1KHF8_9GAMM|nr:hypothetical protein [Marinobacterium zhoushanense]GGB95736.1 hypothetical protein GCM10011352_22270 [Marinobacterium zhoushanense]